MNNQENLMKIYHRIVKALITTMFVIFFSTSGYPASASPLDSFHGLEGTIGIAGGTAHIPVMNDAAKTVMTANPKIRITVEGGGSGIGVQKVGEGLVDIGNTGRPLTDNEIAKFGLKTYPFALDGVAVIVHPDNPLTRLTTQQVKDIFSGTVTNWKDVGGKDAAIHLFTRDEASGTREVFWEKLLGKGNIAGAANVVASNGSMKTGIFSRFLLMLIRFMTSIPTVVQGGSTGL
jgi:phosphate transport system substrate-binding protein